MKKILKMVGWAFLLVILLSVAGGIYMYQTNPLIKAVAQNDESKLFYFPEKEVMSLDRFDFKERFLPVEDSIKICTYDFKPSADTVLGKIFLIHGAGGNVSTYQKLIIPLVQNGYAVYALDWRGFGKSNGVPNYKGVLRDTQVAFQNFMETSKNDSLKTIVYGMSLGGQLAVKIAKDNESEVDLLVLDGSVESAQQLAIDFAPISWLKNRAKDQPEKFNQEYVAVRDIATIKHIPKLIIHSKKDTEVPFSHGEHLFNAANEPKTFWETDTDHVMTLRDYPEETLKRLNGLVSQQPINNLLDNRDL